MARCWYILTCRRFVSLRGILTSSRSRYALHKAERDLAISQRHLLGKQSNSQMLQLRKARASIVVLVLKQPFIQRRKQTTSSSFQEWRAATLTYTNATTTWLHQRRSIWPSTAPALWRTSPQRKNLQQKPLNSSKKITKYLPIVRMPRTPQLTCNRNITFSSTKKASTTI